MKKPSSSYQDTALTAFREVSDALISRRRFEEGRVEQSQAVGAGREAVELATVRYKEGKASYYEVLEAQQQLFPAENPSRESKSRVASRLFNSTKPWAAAGRSKTRSGLE